MALPRKLKLMNVFVDGTSYIGEATEVTLPKVTTKTEDYRAGGMVGDVAINMGLEKLEMDVKFGGMMIELRKLFGEPKIDGTMLRFAGAYQKDDTGEVDAIDVVVRGRFTEIDGGNAKAGDNTEDSFKAQLTYYKLEMAGEKIMEIDLINQVFEVNGEDRLKEHRAAIGL